MLMSTLFCEAATGVITPTRVKATLLFCSVVLGSQTAGIDHSDKAMHIHSTYCILICSRDFRDCCKHLQKQHLSAT